MKQLVLFLSLCTLSYISFAANSGGQIIEVKSNVYKIEYQNQTINIFFKVLTGNKLRSELKEASLGEKEQFEIVGWFKDYLDQLPESFIDAHLNIDVFPLHILNKSGCGYNNDHQLIIEVSDIKEGMSYRNSVKSSFAHQIAHLLENDHDVSTVQKKLDQTYESHPYSAINTGNIYEEGFVSRYASGELYGEYSAREEYAEIFAHLTCQENRSGLMEILYDKPESILSYKIHRFMEFFDDQVPSLYSAYGTQVIPGEIAPVVIQQSTEGSLLAAHEFKSNEAMSYESSGEKTYLKTTKYIPDDNLENQTFTALKTQNPDYQQTTYEYSSQLNAHNQEEPETLQENKKEKKKKKGTGFLIAGAAVYVLLQLLK